MVIGATELILAIMDILGLGLTTRIAIHSAATPHLGVFPWGLAVAAALCLVLALWAITTLVGMLTGKGFARVSMRLIGGVHATVGAYLLLLGIIRYRPGPAWLGGALMAVGLWWYVSFRRAPLPRA